MDFNSYLKTIILGINYKKQFGIADKFGDIIDSILGGSPHCFGPDFFPTVVTEPEQRTLINEGTGNRFTINLSNLILEYNYKAADSAGKKSEFDPVYKEYIKVVIEGLLRKYAITGITRIGCVLRYIIDDAGFVDAVASTVSQNIVSDVDGLRMRLVKKIPLLEGLAIKGVEDYNNILIEIAQDKKRSEVYISIDYQRYYLPVVDIFEKKDLDRLLSEAKQQSSSFLAKFVA